MQYENNLRALVSSHLTMMEQGHKVMPDPDFMNAPHAESQAKSGETVGNNHLDSIRSNVTAAIQSTLRPLDIDIK